MIRSLRRKFIIFAMAAVTILLVVLALAINGMAWYMFERQADTVMEAVVNSNGQFMRKDFRWDPPKQFPFLDIDVMRSARFFIVDADKDGNVLNESLDQIIFVDTNQAVEYAQRVISRGDEKGRIDYFRYAVRKEDNVQRIYFLDMTRERLTMRTLFFVSGVIALVSWMFVLLFVVILSGKVVEPIIRGFEKQKQFITNAGHELKTPLAIIQSNNDAMTLIHGENKYNRNIKAQVIRLSELTSNLLTQARLDEEAELVKDQINISVLVSEMLQPYMDTAQNRGIILEEQIETDIIFQTNRDAFMQMVTLLMDNAMKYTADNGSVSFELKKASGHILITEENSCDPEMNVDPERLFERFYRADTARTQKDQQSGYGIGLSVARSICESLGGQLTANYPVPGKIRFTAKF